MQKKDAERLKVLERIRVYERDGKFDVDVENDPETLPLLPDAVDYLGEKASTRFFTKIANCKAKNYYEKLIKRGEFIIKEVINATFLLSSLESITLFKMYDK